ncbi:MAG TPA: hypothetical protein VJJ72_00770 [Candidatus Paceibacterota bacterium]
MSFESFESYGGAPQSSEREPQRVLDFLGDLRVGNAQDPRELEVIARIIAKVGPDSKISEESSIEIGIQISDASKMPPGEAQDNEIKRITDYLNSPA